MSADDLDALQRKLDVRAEETMRAVAEHERDARLAVAYEELRRGCRGTGDLPPPWHEFYALAREREAMDAVWTEPARRSLRALRDHLSEYLHLPSFDHVLFALAVAVSADLDIGDPLWGLIIGPPSSGKTEAVRLLDLVAHEHKDELTAPGLLSWSKGKTSRPVGILTRIPDPALLTVADFSTVLATSDRGGRDQLFALLRRVHDGACQRDLGNAANALRWAGRVTLLAACTPSIDGYTSHTDALGPRWVYLRVEEQTPTGKRATARKALGKDRLREYRATAALMAAEIVQNSARRVTLMLDADLVRELGEMAVVTCLGRASVERNGYGRREIVAMPVVEEPPRLAGQLGLLARGLLALGLDRAETLRLCRRCALDCIPAARRGALLALAAGESATVGEVARVAGCTRQVARHALEELEAVGAAACTLDDDDDAPAAQYVPRLWSLAGEERETIRDVLNAAQGADDA